MARKAWIALAVLLLVVPHAKAQNVAGAFGQGRTHVVATAGTGRAFDDDYLVLGLGVSYYVIDGLNVGLGFESWSGGDPGMRKLTPSAQYVFYQLGRIKPYVGAFYRRTYVDGLPDIDSAGGRAGVYFQAGRNAYLGAGVVYESYVDCKESTYRSCSSTYPELSLTFAF
jgi:hypothetical protein